jgi:hypothetical protein
VAGGSQRLEFGFGDHVGALLARVPAVAAALHESLGRDGNRCTLPVRRLTQALPTAARYG